MPPGHLARLQGSPRASAHVPLRRVGPASLARAARWRAPDAAGRAAGTMGGEPDFPRPDVESRQKTGYARHEGVP